MVKKGDTLIEVTVAVGIFSMIAIAIVAVMSNGVANAQTALESTLTREEIDTQAEVLRFIHSSHIANINKPEDKYAGLWDAIASRAIELADTAEAQISILQYKPTNCEELYDSDRVNNAFIINSQRLSSFSGNNSEINEVLITNDGGKNTLRPAVTYPRLVYEGSDGSLVNQNGSSLFSAEGIYVIAVKDKNTTAIGPSQARPAFYDFYIRTCWYGNRSSDASTISTVIRLYDPNVVSED